MTFHFAKLDLFPLTNYCSREAASLMHAPTDSAPPMSVLSEQLVAAFLCYAITSNRNMKFASLRLSHDGGLCLHSSTVSPGV